MKQKILYGSDGLRLGLTSRYLALGYNFLCLEHKKSRDHTHVVVQLLPRSSLVQRLPEYSIGCACVLVAAILF